MSLIFLRTNVTENWLEPEKQREKGFGKKTENVDDVFYLCTFLLGIYIFHAIYQSLGSHMAEKEGVCQRASAVPYYRILTGPSQSSN
jgi:hypothetical protein